MWGNVNKKTILADTTYNMVSVDCLESGWVAPSDGMLTVSARASSSSARYWIQDVTANNIIIMITISTSQYYNSGCSPVIKGHTYKSNSVSDAVLYRAQYYYHDSNTISEHVYKDAYPPGSLYMSINQTDPSTLFGGTWVQLKDKFILAAGDTYAAGSIGGEATHKLTKDEMPSHTHTSPLKGYTSTLDSSGNDPIGGNSASSHYTSTTYYTGSAGGDQEHNNMPPYLAVYVWYRTK